jgi:hypothetical protein
MRVLLLAAVAAASILSATEVSYATDGCGLNEYGEFQCLPGARPGVPYRGHAGGRGRRSGGPVSDGCGTNEYGRFACMPGARPGVPYYGPQRPGPDGCGYNIQGEYTCLPGRRSRRY